MPENCECCGAFYDGIFCNKCGASYCGGCGQELDYDFCMVCEPEEYLEDLTESIIPTCQKDEEVKSCDECGSKNACWTRQDYLELKEQVEKEGE